MALGNLNISVSSNHDSQSTVKHPKEGLKQRILRYTEQFVFSHGVLRKDTVLLLKAD